MLSSTRRRHSQLRLVASFALASLVPIVLLGYVIVGQLRDASEAQGIAAYQNATQALLTPVTKVLQEVDDLEAPLPPQVLTTLEAARDYVIAGRPGIRLRYLTPEGRVSYSSVAGEQTTVPRTGWTMPVGDRSWRGAQPATENLPEAVGPLVVSLDCLRDVSLRVGWIEITAPRSLVTGSADVEYRGERRRLVGGLVSLWALMIPIFWSVSRRLKRQVDENERLAQHDALTGLPNRTLLASRLTEALTESVQQQSVVGLMLIDLDDFKDVNDTLGHQAGDVLLQHVSQRIAGAVRPGDTVSRLGGDEFAVVVANAQHPSVISGVAERLLDALERPVQIGEVQVTPGASIGIALSPDHGATVDVLMQRADIAMYAAKAGGLGRRTYSPTIDSHSPSRLGLTSELRAALRTDDQIDLVSSPSSTPARVP